MSANVYLCCLHNASIACNNLVTLSASAALADLRSLKRLAITIHFRGTVGHSGSYLYTLSAKVNQDPPTAELHCSML